MASQYTRIPLSHSYTVIFESGTMPYDLSKDDCNFCFGYSCCHLFSLSHYSKGKTGWKPTLYLTPEATSILQRYSGILQYPKIAIPCLNSKPVISGSLFQRPCKSHSTRNKGHFRIVLYFEIWCCVDISIIIT